ncbi:glycine-rich protein DOT1-like [Miscanthus floridulus]|uniref:glycine-rich protein DOT1-like n=1 Tax=Miscanthus floridulus TaxID=154761 RepID=UPI00345A040E
MESQQTMGVGQADDPGQRWHGRALQVAASAVAWLTIAVARGGHRMAGAPRGESSSTSAGGMVATGEDDGGGRQGGARPAVEGGKAGHGRGRRWRPRQGRRWREEEGRWPRRRWPATGNGAAWRGRAARRDAGGRRGCGARRGVASGEAAGGGKGTGGGGGGDGSARYQSHVRKRKSRGGAIDMFHDAQGLHEWSGKDVEQRGAWWRLRTRVVDWIVGKSEQVD